ncbi:EF-hand calcium-binding domain-containing protein 4A isoform X3 [Pseudopipra pipra]|uniref:EF-hand calcium-binding domain-containing protein 4A isoform X3 n=1 Tax=Pseudopipra pipra TaxID=415032 RepID=UPI00313A3B5D
MPTGICAAQRSSQALQLWEGLQSLLKTWRLDAGAQKGSSSVCPCPEGKDFEKMENQRGVLLGYVRWEGEEEGDEEDQVASCVSPSSQTSRLQDVEVEMLEKARELFQLCDKDEKGFITKVDMQRLQSELPLTLQQLETVFDSLEQNNKGYLTPVEFSMGLGKLIGIELCQGAGRMDHSRHEETFESGWSDDLDPADDDEEKRFCSMMEQLGAAQLFEDPHEIRELWARLRKERPELLSNFEEFLLRVSSYIKEVNHEKESMEQALKRKESDHDREVRCLYEEMEQQIKAERERLVCQEALRHDRSNLLQKELHNKEQELEKILYRQKKVPQNKKPLLKKGSVLGSYLLDDKPVKRQLASADLPFTFPADVAVEEPNRKNCKYFPGNRTWMKTGEGESTNFGDNPRDKERWPLAADTEWFKMTLKGDTDCRKKADGLDAAPLPPRAQPVGTETRLQALEPASCSPDRIFKVVFVGNSGVGKSSFIHRFCYDRFLAELNATIGIDYQVKSLMVDNTQVALQLWDTAGQERFRSITKQYFRKADGILVMYDMTAECSFMAVRNWMSSIQEGIEDGAVVFLLGNKMDAVQRETRNVPKVEGERLAKEYKAVFYECSAMTGYNIMEPMLHMARLLTAQEDRQRENALQLEDIGRRKGCCT